MICAVVGLLAANPWPHLSAEHRGVLYAPFVPSAASTDLYSDANHDAFMRDARVLQELGATTLLLEPWAEGDHHQALYNATTFVRERNDTLDPDQQSRPQSSNLKVVPAFQLTPLMLGGTPDKATANLPAICASAQSFVRSSLTPAAPNIQRLPGDRLVGGGPPESKLNTSAFNLLLLPNDATLWSHEWFEAHPNRTTLYDAATKIIKCMHDQIRRCTGTNHDPDLPGCGVTSLPASIPIVVTLADNPPSNEPLTEVDLSADQSIQAWKAATKGSVARLGGFLVATSRRRGCGADLNTVAAAVANAAADLINSADLTQQHGTRQRKKEHPLVWFAVGVDAYDDQALSPYRTIRVDGAKPYLSDVRTECLLQQLDSLEEGCEAVKHKATCGVVVEEYVDSFWRAHRSASTTASRIAGEACATTNGRTAGFDGADWRVVGEAQLPPGMVAPSDVTSYHTKQLHCGAHVPCWHPQCHNLTSLTADRVEDLINVTGILPGFLLCDPNQTRLDSALDRYEVPGCETRARHHGLDSTHNAAFDGLMEPVPAHEVEDFCNDRYTHRDLAVRPRRAFYALQKYWNPAAIKRAHMVTSFHDWPIFTPPNQTVYKLFNAWTDPDGADFVETIGEAGLWAGLYLLLIACFVTTLRAILGRSRGGSSRRRKKGVWASVKGRWTVLLLSALVVSFNYLDIALSLHIQHYLPLPCLVTYDVMLDVLSISIFYVLWCPLNGGGGSGQWWWVHFLVFGIFITVDDKGRWTDSGGFRDVKAFTEENSCRRTYPIFTIISAVLSAGLGKAPTTNPLVSPPLDVCRSGHCCVRNTSNPSYFPWSPEVPVPQLWEPFLEWKVVVALAVLSLAITVALALLLCIGCQLAWWATARRKSLRRLKKGDTTRATLSNVWSSIAVSDSVSAKLVDKKDVVEAIDEASGKLKIYFGDHFSKSAYAQAKLVCTNLLDSRGRREHGYADISSRGMMPPTEPLVAPFNGHASAIQPTLPGAPSGSNDPPPPPQEPQTSPPAPTLLTHASVREIWAALLDNMFDWIREVNFQSPEWGPAKTTRVFKDQQCLLHAHGNKLEKLLLENLPKAMVDHSDMWEIIQLYLLVGSESFFRTMPETVNLIFSVYSCCYIGERLSQVSFGGIPPGDEAQATPNGIDIRLLPAEEAVYTYLTGSSGEVASRNAAHERLLKGLGNFRAGLYELHRYGGGKTSNRMLDFLREKIMNYDDIGELCSMSGAQHLFQGMEALAVTLYDQARQELCWAMDLVRILRFWREHIRNTASQRLDSRPNSGKSDTSQAASVVGSGSRRPADLKELLSHRPSKDRVAHLHWCRIFLRVSRRMWADLMQKFDDETPSFADLNEAEKVACADLKVAQDELMQHLLDYAAAEDDVAHRTAVQALTRIPILPNASVETLVFRSLQMLLLVLTREGLRPLVQTPGNANLLQEVDAALAACATLMPEKEDEKSEEKIRTLEGTLMGLDHMSGLKKRLQGPGSMSDLAAVHAGTRNALNKAGLGLCVEKADLPTRFTWGNDAHKTYEETTGYGIFIMETWFLWRSLFLACFGITIYVSGGYLGWYFGTCLSLMSKVIEDKIQVNKMLRKFFENKTFVDKVATPLGRYVGKHAYAGTWLKFYLLLGLMYHILDVFHDFLSLRRAMSVHSKTEHSYWRVCRELRKAYGEGRFLLAMRYELSVCCCGPDCGSGRDSRFSTTTMLSESPMTARRTDTQVLLNSSTVRARPQRSTNGPHRKFKSFKPHRSTFVASFVYEATSAFYPVRVFAFYVGLLLLYVLMLLAWPLNICLAVPLEGRRRRFFGRAAALVLRIVWIGTLVAVWPDDDVASPPAAEEQGRRELLTLLLFTQAWWAILASIFSAGIAHCGPKDILCCTPAYNIFGWWYEWMEAEWSKRFAPRERRNQKEVSLNAVFFFAVFALKLLFSFSQMDGIARTIHSIHTEASGLIFGSGDGRFYSMVVQYMLVALAAVFRIAYAVFFELCDLQLFFAAVIALAGAFTSAKTSIFVWLGSVWDRKQNLGADQLKGAAKGFAHGRPVMQQWDDDDETATTEDAQLVVFRKFWNECLVFDMLRSNQIDGKLAKALEMGGDASVVLPDLQKLVPTLCYDARRRILDFISYATRTKGVPFAPRVACMPSMTILMPAYGETVLRSWMQMFIESNGQKQADLRYMTELRNVELLCFFKGLPKAEQEVLSPHMERLTAEHAILVNVETLRDALWFSDWLRILALAGAMGASKDSHIGQSLRIAKIMLDGALLGDAPGPTAHPSASMVVLAELADRERFAKQAAAFHCPKLDQLVDDLYEGVIPDASWGALVARLRKMEKGPSARHEEAVEALGARRDQGWSEDIASPLCRELRRTKLEAAVKFKLRVWFSNREQAVWRTIEGLCKAEECLRQLHDYECQCSGEQIEYPDSLVTIVASFQIYGDWRKKLGKLLGDAEASLAHVLAGRASADSLRAMLMPPQTHYANRDNQLIHIYDQIGGVHTLLSDFGKTDKFFGLQVAYIDNSFYEQGATSSVLCVKGSGDGQMSSGPLGRQMVLDAQGQPFVLQTKNRLPLPGNPVLDGFAEGKPSNQSNGMLHVASELVMVVDMNQGAGMRQMLTKFHTDDFGVPAPEEKKDLRIIGFRENVFTDADGIVAKSGALNEYVFGTIIQRQMYVTLNCRLHYGHPDVFDFAYSLVHGGTSKSSKTINMSEDIFGGINVFLRGGQNEYVDFLQVDKGRDVQYDATLSFEGKIASGCGVHCLSRDFQRLMGSPLCFFHKVSLFLGSIGIFFSNTMLALAVLTLLALNTTCAMLPPALEKIIYLDTPVQISLLNLGFVYLFAVVVQMLGERGIVGALDSCATIILTIPLNLAKIKVHQYYVHRAIVGGVSRYIGTGRDLATTRVDFSEVFARYSYSHLAPALDMAVLIFLFCYYSSLSSSDKFHMTLAPTVVTMSWLAAPAIYNPFAFSVRPLLHDWRKWGQWADSAAYDDWWFGQKVGERGGKIDASNWYFWLNAEPAFYRYGHAIVRLALWGGIFFGILLKLVSNATRTFDPHASAGQLVLAHNLTALADHLVIFIPLGVLLLAVAKLNAAIIQVFFGCLFAGAGVVFLMSGHGADFLLLLYPVGKALGCLVELYLTVWSCRPWIATDSDTPKEAVASVETLALPRRSAILAALFVRTGARMHAYLQAMLYFGFSFAMSAFMLLPISGVVILLVCWALHGLLISALWFFIDPVNPQAPSGAWVASYMFGLALPVWAFFAFLRGSPMRRRPYSFSYERFLLLTLNLGTLHNCFIFNWAVALDLAERAASSETNWFVER